MTVKVKMEGWAKRNGTWAKQWSTVSNNPSNYKVEDDGWVYMQVTWAYRHWSNAQYVATKSFHIYVNGGDIYTDRWKNHVGF